MACDQKCPAATVMCHIAVCLHRPLSVRIDCVHSIWELDASLLSQRQKMMTRMCHCRNEKNTHRVIERVPYLDCVFKYGNRYNFLSFGTKISVL